MGRIIKKEVAKPLIKKVSTSNITKPMSKEELIQRRKETQKFYAQMSLKRAKDPSPAVSKIVPPTVRTKNIISKPIFKPTITKDNGSRNVLQGSAKKPDPVSNSVKHVARDTPRSSKLDFEFKSSASSLQMIKSGNIQIENIGRFSMRSKKKVDLPRMSLLPLGINVFAKNTSDADKQKVFDFMRNQNQNQVPETEMRRCSLFGTPGRNRSVRFHVEDAIPETCESVNSNKDDSPKSSTFEFVCNTSTQPAPHSILKKKKRLSKASQDYIASKDGSFASDPKASNKLVFASSSEESGNENEDPAINTSTPHKKNIKFVDTQSPQVKNAEQFYKFLIENRHFFEDMSQNQKKEIRNLVTDASKEYMPELDESSVSLKSLPTDTPAKVRIKKEIRILSDKMNTPSSLRRSLRIGRRDTDSDG